MERIEKQVAPFTGAWIEIIGFRVRRAMTFTVAPFTGAWIEMSRAWKKSSASRSVAPFTGAWIEILAEAELACDLAASHPSRVRGLKFKNIMICIGATLVSHPSRVRGLKYGICRHGGHERPGRTLHGCVD